MCKFIEVTVSKKGKKGLEPLRVNTKHVKSYRKWLNEDGSEQTVLQMNDGEKIIVNEKVTDIDKATK